VSYPDIERLIPQRGAMLLLDAVTADGADEIVCRASVRPDNLFLRPAESGPWLRAAVCLEYMAQTVAAYAGLHALREGERGAARIGYLIAASGVELRVARLALGDELEISAQRLWGDAGLGKFAAAVERRGTRVAVATLSVYRPPAAAEGSA
jgi:predicted hotdog family 3-hydroxylacyl-ACP dehydratase